MLKGQVDYLENALADNYEASKYTGELDGSVSVEMAAIYLLHEEKGQAMNDISAMMRVLAFFCRICPFCICARQWPESRFAGFLKKVEGSCPACRAYAQVNGKEF